MPRCVDRFAGFSRLLRNHQSCRAIGSSGVAPRGSGRVPPSFVDLSFAALCLHVPGTPSEARRFALSRFIFATRASFRSRSTISSPLRQRKRLDHRISDFFFFPLSLRLDLLLPFYWLGLHPIDETDPITKDRLIIRGGNVMACKRGWQIDNGTVTSSLWPAFCLLCKHPLPPCPVQGSTGILGGSLDRRWTMFELEPLGTSILMIVEGLSKGARIRSEDWRVWRLLALRKIL